MLIAFSGLINAQISGKIFQYGMELPGVKVYLQGSGQIVETDLYGNFNLPLTKEKEKNNLIIQNGIMVIKIQNIVLRKSELNLGKIELPVFKIFEDDEFENLSESEKENCFPTDCYGEFLGYLYTNELQTNYLTLNCKETITDFIFDTETKTIIVNWNLIKNCI